MRTITIHTGELAVNNGIQSPLGTMKQIREVIEGHGTVSYALRPENDRIVIDDDMFETLIELLIEGGIPYKVEGFHTCWQNLRDRHGR